MTIDDDIWDLWHKMDIRMKWQLAGIWLEMEEGKLERLEEEVMELEGEVIRELRAIHDTKDEKTLKHHMKKLLKLIHHVEPTRQWQRDMQKEIYEIVQEAKIARAAYQRAHQIVERRKEARSQAISSRVVVVQEQHRNSVMMNFFRPVTRGMKTETVHVAIVYGVFENRETFRMKRIEIKGKVYRSEINKIVECIGLSREHVNDNIIVVPNNPLNVDIIIDFGDEWPIVPGRTFFAYTDESGVIHPQLEQEWREDIIPSLRYSLSIKKLSFDEHQDPVLRIDAHSK